MSDYKKILVIRFSSLGDVILTTPVLKILRENFPKAEIHYCTKHQYAELLKNNPNIDNLIEVDDDLSFVKLKELRKKLTAEKYNLVIDLHNNLRTFYLRFYLQFDSRVIKFKKYSFRKFLLVKFKINLLKELPSIALRYARTLGKADIRIDVKRDDTFTPEINIDEYSKESVRTKLSRKNIDSKKQLISIVPCTKHFTKTYPAEYFEELINKFDKNKYSIVLVGSGDDKTVIDELAAKTNAVSLCDELNLKELAELMSMSALVISGDTGPMHITEAVNAPLVMLAGSSVREFGFYPQSVGADVIENKGLSCRPCSHIGRESCPKGHFKCMKELKPDMVYERSIKILEKM